MDSVQSHNPKVILLTQEENTKKFIETPMTKNTQCNPEQNNTVQGIPTPDFRMQGRDLVMKAVCHTDENRCMDQQNIIKDPDTCQPLTVN